MISAAFIVDTLEFDEEFHRLDERIIQAAKETTGYIGEEAWENPKTGRVCTVYYWEGREGLLELMGNADHRQAKAGSHRWLQGYQVIVSEIVASYGTDNYPHPLLGRNFGKSQLRSSTGENESE